MGSIIKLNWFINFFNLFQSWGGKENGFGLAECCQNLPITVRIKTSSYINITDTLT